MFKPFLVIGATAALLLSVRASAQDPAQNAGRDTGFRTEGEATTPLPSGVDPNCHPPADPHARFYPPQASRRRIAGWAQIRCRVAPNGDLTECSVLDEAPKNLCFGTYALSMTRNLRAQPSPADAVPRFVTKTIRFDPSS